MSKPVDALDYLAKPSKHPAAGVCVLFGDEAFLKRQVLSALKQQVLSGDDAEFSVSIFAADVLWRDVSDALATRALFGGGRHVVVIEEADEFVSRNRPTLEEYVARAAPSSLLVLTVKQWPSTTRLFKALAERGLQIECRFPPPARLAKWLAARSREEHGAELEPAAAELLAETVEPELGLLDQELAKLAALAGGGTVTGRMVQDAVVGWRAKTAWEMLDAALAGETRAALDQLDRLLMGGEVPIALLAQLAASLRRLAAATRLIEQGERARRRTSLRDALQEAGVKPFVIAKAEAQLRRLGRDRGAQLYEWLLEADLALKGSSSSGVRARLVLEELIVRIAAPPKSQRPAPLAR